MACGNHVVSAVACSLGLISHSVTLLSVAGTDTTATAMAWWTLAIVAYPETQARAHAELDAVVGRSRLPTFADYPHLPYIRAMAKEVLRWRPVGPLGLPHRSIEDDWYEGMFIPKGTICIPNVWNMNHDPEIYGESVEQFDPARYLDAKMDAAPSLSDTAEEGRVAFGFGRRQCVGRHLANNLLFIEMATVLWATRVQRKKDPSGQLLPLDVDGFVDQGVSMLVDLSQTPKFDANSGASADVQCPSSARSFRASQRLLPCLHRNVSCVGCEHEVTWRCIHM